MRLTHLNNDCMRMRGLFSAYIDGAATGVEMNAIASHLEGCGPCEAEFSAWRSLQSTLASLAHERGPADLQRKLRAALATERERGTHLSLPARLGRLWDATLAPMALRVSGGLAAALLLAGGLGWAFGAPLTVQANDDNLANLVAPRYLASVVPPLPIATRRDTPIVLEAKVDREGRVYDFAILDGPSDARTVLQVENNLLNSYFAPATVFGVPVEGHVLLTYTGVSVRG